MSVERTDTILDEIKEEFNYQVNNFNVDGINNLADLISNSTGNVHVCGVGKSGNTAKHCCDLLKSISIAAFNLDVLNSTHGDLGALKEGDILISFSSSGNTQELLDIVDLLKRKKIKMVSVCCNASSKLSKVCDVNIITPHQQEISGNINKIPTNSIMSQLLFINILTSILKTHIDIEQYKGNHTSGNIGNNLLKIQDILLTKNYPLLRVDQNSIINIYDVMLQMTDCKIGCCYFIDGDHNLTGILTGGDCRRLLLKNKQTITINDINVDCYYECNVDLFLTEIKKLHVKYIPILKNKKLLGIIDTSDVVKFIS